jgi:SPP1 family predicted phage head-tail adaptor
VPTQPAPLAGTLNRRMLIQQGRPSTTAEGDAVLTWSSLGEVWAEISPASTQELLLAAQRGEELTHSITVRYQPQFLTPADLRVIFGSRIFYVSSVVDPDEAHWVLSFKCREYVSGLETGAT